MTTDQFLEINKKLFADIIERDIPLQIASQDTHAMQVTRIFVNGETSQGLLIGKGRYNDTDPLYVNPIGAPGKGFTPAGKPFAFGKTKGGKEKTVRATTRLVKGESKKHTTRWFPSYKAFRDEIGKETSLVNLELSGDLKSDFSNRERPIKVNVHEYVSGLKRDDSVKKVDGFKNKPYYGNIFAPTKEEQQNFQHIGLKEFNLLVRRAFNV